MIKSKRSLDLRPSLFWDTKIEKLDFEKNDVSIMTRFLRYGSKSEIEKMIDFYTLPVFLEKIKKANNLNKKIVDTLAAKYNIKKVISNVGRKYGTTELLRLLKELQSKEYMQDFFLAGDTALALQLGHRISIDLDLFTHKGFNGSDILKKIEKDGFKIGYEKGEFQGLIDFDRLICFIDGIKIDLWKEPFVKTQLEALIEIDGIKMAGLKDISAMKILAGSDRNSKKDYCDIIKLLDKYSFKEMVEHFEKRYHFKHRKINDAVTNLFKVEMGDADIDPVLVTGEFDWDTIKNKIKLEINNYQSI